MNAVEKTVYGEVNLKGSVFALKANILKSTYSEKYYLGIFCFKKDKKKRQIKMSRYLAFL